MIEYLIVGSGFTASVICIHLIDTGINPKKITVIGPTKLGQGNAFNCPNDEYRLNVRSEIMWIYPEKKSEFTNWAKIEIIDNDALMYGLLYYLTFCEFADLLICFWT